MSDQHAQLSWLDGTIPISDQFADPYFSLDNGLAETRHVFLAGNDLPARFGGDFHIAELGFGTGLNFLVTWQSWIAAGRPGHLRFTTFDAYPMAVPDMARALAAFPELDALAIDLTKALKHPACRHAFDGVTLTIVSGDVRDTLPNSQIQADAWFLDGFSPAKNPQMWGPELLRAVGTHTRPGGTLATYTAAGHVRRALTDAGFDVVRVAGYGRKRHMTRARKT